MDLPNTRRESEVWQACDDLWVKYATFSKLTGDAIRDQLVVLGYKKGSPNEIYKFRRTWKFSRGIFEEDAATQTDEVQNDPISRAVFLVYEQMQTKTKEELEKRQVEFDEQLADLQNRLELLTESHESLQVINKDQFSQITCLEEECQRLKGELFLEKNEHAILKEKYCFSEKMFEEYKVEISRVQLELKSLHEEEVDLWRAKIQEMTQEKERSLLKLEETYKTQWYYFSEQVNLFQVQLRQLHEKSEILLKNFTVQQEKNKELKEELVIANRELAKKHQEAEQLNKKYNALNVKQATMRGELSMANKRGNEFKVLLQNLKRELNVPKRTDDDSIAQ